MDLIEDIRRESIYISSVSRTLLRMRHVKPDSPITFVDILGGFAKETPSAPAILYLDRTLTYKDLDGASNRYAHWARAAGVAKGDVVGLLMENRPEYLAAWIGLHKAGAAVALLNTNQRGMPLAHSMTVAGAQHLILGAELAETYAEARPLLQKEPKVWVTGSAVQGFEDLDAALAEASSAAADPAWRHGVIGRDNAFLIFTSGTTGLPKAANFSHMRTLYMMYGFSGALDSKPGDRMYNVLPLYHTAGGICATGAVFTTGGSVVIKRKFSVHEFWQDCFAYKPTFFQYIGELCRYLLNAPHDVHERSHVLRAITGNGLRPEIWPQFQTRFEIPKIIEFYGATEGNVSMLNYDGKVGAVGRVPWYVRGIITTRIVRFDIEREMPIRGADGLCSECAANEVGEAIGLIADKPGQNFEGYTQGADTEKKILRNVFKHGDAWFRTGDLMKRDEHDYFYFVDRIGDTFRWKGENVATSEVSEALGVVPGIQEANVYGVQVPGQDGRAGMAALVVTPQFDPAKLSVNLAANLPGYARPVFLRLEPEMQITGTFKQRKVDLVNDGFNPQTIPNPLYILDPATQQYRPLDKALYDAVISGGLKL
ncbi:MAG TPA: long-chain-acyl-CoA synthetase [Rhizomicrobium sp.]|nr:long-chain-acyl-CoA synthetase [Rhizomicrobium sp.]